MNRWMPSAFSATAARARWALPWPRCSQRGADVTLVAGPVCTCHPLRVHDAHRRPNCRRNERRRAATLGRHGLGRGMCSRFGFSACGDFFGEMASRRHAGGRRVGREPRYPGDHGAIQAAPSNPHWLCVGKRRRASQRTRQMARKNLDAIVLNSLKDDGAGFGHDTNKVSVLFQGGKSVSFELKSKYEVACDLVELWRTTLNP